MELTDLKFLAAASLLAGSVKDLSAKAPFTTGPTRAEIECAVETAQRVWEEVLKQDREK